MSHKAFAVVAGISLMLSACPQHVSPARQLPVETGRPRGPKQPAEVAFGRPDDTGRWLRLREVRYEEGKVFGWRIRLPCRQPVEYLEVMTLPSPGELAIDPEEIRETTISADSRIFVTTPAPTVLPPSRIAKRRPSSHAIADTARHPP
jgi:hypothetical protein